MKHWLQATVAIGLVAGLLAVPARADVRVVVSIKPLHSLTASVMAGHGTPKLIVSGGNSPHTYAMKPSDAEALQHADLVFWMGPGLERFLVKPLDALAGHAQVVTLSQADSLVRYPMRQGGAWESDADEAGHGDLSASDIHMWMDPVNAGLIAETIAAALERADPANAADYAANAEKLKSSLNALTQEMTRELSPLKAKPFIVFHDAYQYLERRFSLNAVGSVTIAPDIAPGAKRVGEIRDRIKALGVQCIFTEPEFRPAIVEAVREGTEARVGVLDPLGADLPDGPDLYIRLMQRNEKALTDCLGG